MVRLDWPRIYREAGATLRLASPLILGQLSAMGMNVVDALLAGHMSATILAAVAVGASVWTLVIVMIIGVLMALPPSVSQLEGAGERHLIGSLFRQALWLALGLGMLLLVAVRMLGRPLIMALQVDEEIIGDALDFLQAISYGAPALALYFALRGLSEGTGNTRPTMYFGFLGLLLLIPLGYSLMYGKVEGISGAFGLGAATAIVLWIQFLSLLTYICLHPHYRIYRLFAHLEGPNVSSIASLLTLGIPMGVALLLEASLFVIAALLIAALGAIEVASHQVALSIASVAFMLPLGLAMAITVRVGHAVGRGDPSGVRYAGYTGIAMTLVTQTLSAALMTFFPEFIVGLYTSDPKVTVLALKLLALAALFQFSDGIQVAANGALRGLKDTKRPMLITLIAYWGVGMPIGYLLAFRQKWGAPGMWVGLIAGLSVAALLLFARFYRRVRVDQVILA